MDDLTIKISICVNSDAEIKEEQKKIDEYIARLDKRIKENKEEFKKIHSNIT